MRSGGPALGTTTRTKAALAAPPADAREWRSEALARDPADLDEGEAPATADAEGLRRFLEAEVLPWLETRKTALANRWLVREQAFGEALNPDKLERLGRYEVHLDRKLERMLSMLLRLKDLRRGGDSGVIRLAKWSDFASGSVALPSRHRPRRP